MIVFPPITNSLQYLVPALTSIFLSILGSATEIIFMYLGAYKLGADSTRHQHVCQGIHLHFMNGLTVSVITLGGNWCDVVFQKNLHIKSKLPIKQLFISRRLKSNKLFSKMRACMFFFP